jgi:hypothetical protein
MSNTGGGRQLFICVMLETVVHVLVPVQCHLYNCPHQSRCKPSHLCTHPSQHKGDIDSAHITIAIHPTQAHQIYTTIIPWIFMPYKSQYVYRVATNHSAIHFRRPVFLHPSNYPGWSLYMHCAVIFSLFGSVML